MATKISQLDLIASLSTSDVIPVVDVSDEVTNKCTVAQLLALASAGLPIELDTDDADALIKIGPDPSGGTFPAIGVIQSQQQADGTDRVLIAMKDAANDDIAILAHDWVRIAIGATWDQSDDSAGTTTRIAKVGIFADTHEVYADRRTLTDDRGSYYRYVDETIKQLATANATPTALGLANPAPLAGGGFYAKWVRATSGGDTGAWVVHSNGETLYRARTGALATADFDGTNVTGIAGAVQWNGVGIGPVLPTRLREIDGVLTIHHPSGGVITVPNSTFTIPTSGGSPAGSSGDLQTNNAGAFGSLTPGTNVASFLAANMNANVASFTTTPSSANLRALLTDETGTGVAVFSNTPFLTTPRIQDSDSSHSYQFAVSNLAADRQITLPLLTGNDTFVFEAHTQTLTNKTMSGASNTFSNIPITALTGSSANLASVLSDETGTGACVFADAPVPTGTWSWASGGAVGFTGATAHATSGMIRVPYAATQTIIGARTSATTTVALLSSIAADNYQLGDATAFNIDVAGANTSIVASSTLTLYGGSVAGTTLSSTTMNLKPGNVSALALFNTPNASFFSAAGSFGSGTAVIFIANRTAAPSSNPTGGGILYAESGALKWRGSGGTVTTIAPA